MKILQVVHTFLPKFVAGTEVYAYEITQALKKTDNEIRMVYTDPLATEYSLKKLEYKGITCYEIQKDVNNIYSFENSFQDTQAENFFIDILDDYRPDIIHYQHLMFLSTNVVKEVKKRGIRQVITMHDFWYQCLTHKRITTDNQLCLNPTLDKCMKCHYDLMNRVPSVPSFRIANIPQLIFYFGKKGALPALENKIKKRFINYFNYHYKPEMLMNQLTFRLNTFRDVLKTVDLVIFPTKFLQQELYEWKLKGNNDLVSHDGIQKKYFKNFRKIKSKILRFGFIGSIVPAKGLLVLVNAWTKINTKNTVLKIYGKFSDDPDYAKKIKKIIHKIKNIKLMGTFRMEDIAKVFKQLDVLIVPSTWFENAPLVLRNAFLAGIPVIGTNLGGISELIKDKVNGLLFENENSDDLSNKINDLISNPDLIHKFRYPYQKSMEENAEELISIYKQLLKND